MALSVIILTFNAERTIAQTLTAAHQVSDDIHVIDSGSSDATLSLIAATNAITLHHPFENYGAQRNWAIDNAKLRHSWQLHLDADEMLSPALAAAINQLKTTGFAGDKVGYFIPRLVKFMGAEIRHGGMYPIWHMRLFKTGYGRCETRRYDQHFLINGPAGQLPYPMIDDIQMSLSEWTIRHNRWADAEADELQQARRTEGLVTPDPIGNPIERKRARRDWYNRAPLFWRALLLFFYRYILRRGFLDGKPGLIFFVLQSFWFRFLVDAKLYERSVSKLSDG